MKIREAKKEDFVVVFKLIKALWSYNEYEYDNTYKTYCKILEEENSFAYVVEDETEIVGFCHGDYFPTLWMCGDTCYLSGIITRDDQRRKGVGTFMMDYIKKMAKEKKSKAIILDSGMPRTGAHEFYQRYGFEKSCYGFELAI
ncbi:MAG: GNAT family N-acetyltransferase [Butyrivibrio sp.]|nr:GNAT family N-acetyltransferase [Butyrivibrio sp.]